MIEIVGIVLEIVHPTLFDKNSVYKIPKQINSNINTHNNKKNLLWNVQIMLYNHLRVNKVRDSEE
jgi:hypothetical protein